MELNINNEKYKYEYNGAILKQTPEQCNLNFTKKDITEYKYYQKQANEYNYKVSNSKKIVIDNLSSFMYIIEVILIMYIFVPKDFLKIPIYYFPIFIIFLIILLCWIMVCIHDIFGDKFVEYQEAILKFLVPQCACEWIVITFCKKPIPPNKASDIESYELQLRNYRDKYEGVENYNYQIVDFSLSCMYELIDKLIKYTENRNNKIKQNNIKLSKEYWFKLDPYDFEKEVALWFRNKGYETTLTSKSGDGGIDIVLKYNEEETYVQCKRFTKSKVDRPTLNALYGVMCADNIKHGIVACLIGATNEAKQFAKKVGIKIITINELCSNTDLFHNICLEKEINTIPQKNSDYWCRIGTILIQTVCYQSKETALNNISRWDKSQLFHVTHYKGLYFIIYVEKDLYENIAIWIKDKRKAITDLNSTPSNIKYKKRATYYRNRNHY